MSGQPSAGIRGRDWPRGGPIALPHQISRIHRTVTEHSHAIIRLVSEYRCVGLGRTSREYKADAQDNVRIKFESFDDVKGRISAFARCSLSIGPVIENHSPGNLILIDGCLEATGWVGRRNVGVCWNSGSPRAVMILRKHCYNVSRCRPRHGELRTQEQHGMTSNDRAGNTSGMARSGRPHS